MFSGLRASCFFVQTGNPESPSEFGFDFAERNLFPADEHPGVVEQIRHLVDEMLSTCWAGLRGSLDNLSRLFENLLAHQWDTAIEELRRIRLGWPFSITLLDHSHELLEDGAGWRKVVVFTHESTNRVGE